MVAINKLAFVGALAATAVAVPVAAPEATEVNIFEQANALAAALATIDSFSTHKTDNDIAKRDGLLGPVGDLLGQVGGFLGTTIRSLLTLNLPNQSTATAQLLVDVNTFLLNLENSLKGFKPASGLAGALQDLLINSGLQSLVLGLTTIVSSLVAFLLSNGKIDPAVQAQIQALNTNIANLGAAFEKAGSPAASLGKLASQLTGALNGH